MRRLSLTSMALMLALLTGCGDGGDGSSGSGASSGGAASRLVVSAGSSMTAALTDCAAKFSAADVQLQFSGSDQLAAQIREGAEIDVFVSASAKLADELADEGALDTPVVVATNDLVVAVPMQSTRVGSIEDLAGAGVKIAMGAPGVPAGDYARDAVEQLGEPRSTAILANVRSAEPDVKGVVGKVAQGAADAGFVYRTDVQAADGELKAIEFSEEINTTTGYAAGMVSATDQGAQSQSFIEDLRSGTCQDALLAAGFGEP